MDLICKWQTNQVRQPVREPPGNDRAPGLNDLFSIPFSMPNCLPIQWPQSSCIALTSLDTQKLGWAERVERPLLCSENSNRMDHRLSRRDFGHDDGPKEGASFRLTKLQQTQRTRETEFKAIHVWTATAIICHTCAQEGKQRKLVSQPLSRWPAEWADITITRRRKEQQKIPRSMNPFRSHAVSSSWSSGHSSVSVAFVQQHEPINENVLIQWSYSSTLDSEPIIGTGLYCTPYQMES